MPTYKKLAPRTKEFAYSVFHLIQSVELNYINRQIIQQLIDSSFSIASNYRATNRAKSPRDFNNKLKIVLEEADESLFWLNCLNDLQIADESKCQSIIDECDQIIAILVTMLKNRGVRNS